MHEMTYVVRFVNLAIETAEKHHAEKVEKLVVEVGEMTDIDPYYLQKYYPAAVKDTILEGSVLETEKIPVKVSCDLCGLFYHPDNEHRYLCPSCGSGAGRIVEGRGVTLKQVVIETQIAKPERQEESSKGIFL